MVRFPYWRAASVSWPMASPDRIRFTSAMKKSSPRHGRSALSGGLRLPLAFALIALASPLFAQPAAPPAKPAVEQPLREIYVPFEDLNIILEGPTQRVFLTRQEYDDLVAKAKTKPQTNVPHKLALVAAEYEAQLEDGRALLTGNLSIEVLDEGLFALPLDLAGVGIRSALLDGKPAPLARDGQQRPIVLMQGKGMHKLVLSLTAPLQTAAAQQSLYITLPTTSAARLKLAVPGNVEVKGGAAVVDRQYDMGANLTRLELLPQRGGMAIVMSLNNKLLREQRVVVARSVLVDEVTQGYERIHATVSHRVLHGAVDKLRFAVPAGFEVTKVESTLLARWEEKTDAGGKKTLEATLREPTTDQIVLEISANRSPAGDEDWLASLASWKFPRLEPLDVAGQVALIGLLVEDRLQPQNIASTGLLPIDAAVLASAIPASVLKAEPGAPTVRQVVTYYAPAAEYDLTARFIKPPAGLKVATNSLLVIGDGGLSLTGGFALTPEAESLFDFRFTAPKGWQVKQVTRADGTPLAIERYPTTDGGTRILVRLGAGISVNQSATVNFEAVNTPTGWLAEWTTQKVDYPQLVVEGATSDSGAVAAQTLDDLVVRPDKLTGLTPLVDAEKAAFGLADLPTALAYRYIARPFAATLSIERTKPSLMAEVFSFLKIEPDNLDAHYELNYDVRESRTRQLVFSLPNSTPTELTIRGLGDVVVKEFRSVDDGDRRRWLVQLAERKIGLVKLAVDFQQRLPEGTLKAHGLPLVQAEEVEYQSAFVAVEGDAELDVQVATAARRVDVGELAGAEYLVGRRVIGAFGYVGTKADVKVDVVRRDPYALPPALVQKATLETSVSAAGRLQSWATYDLLTKASLLEIRLPANSTLWTISVDRQPTKPQKEAGSLLLSLPAQDHLAVRQLKIVYETPGNALGLAAEVEAVAPVLLVRAKGTDDQRTIPQADLDWTLHLPTGYVLRRSDGTVYPDTTQPRELAAVKVAKFLYVLSGGVNPGYWLLSREYAATAKLAKPQANDGYFEMHDQSAAMPAAEMPSPTPSAASVPAEAMPVPTTPETKPADMPAAPPPPPMAMPAADPFAAPKPEPQVQLDMAHRFEALEKLSEEASARKHALEALKERVDNAEQEAAKKSLESLQGVSSLVIDRQGEANSTGQSLTFRSLGENPQLRAAVIDNRRIEAAAWGLALLVGLVGVGLTFHSCRRQATYVIVVLLASSVPLLLTDWLDEVALVFDYVFFAGCALAAYFPLAALAIATCRWIKGRFPACCVAAPAVQQIAGLLVAVSLSLIASASATAQEPSNDVRIVNLKDILPLIEDGKPVAVPADALIVPYDPEKPIQESASEKLLVPYAKYVELWNRANPDKKIITTKLPVDFALAGATYETTLAAVDALQIRGTIEIDVFSEKPVAVPLHLAGGVLVKATVDGAAARLQVVEPAAPQPNATAQQMKPAANPPPQQDGPPARLLLLHLSGTGRKKLEIAVQLGLTRQGGWRIVRGQLPVSPATALTLTVPQAGTEVRQQGLADRALFETKADNEKIETALGDGGLVDLQWRAKVSEGQVDQSLTARSTAVLDVREDSLRLVWQVRLEFGRAFRDAFTLSVPKGYLVEQVSGDNLRGWTAKEVGSEQTIDVTLLKAAQGSETLTVQLARRGRVGQGDLAEFVAPTVLVIDAALQQGEIAVRRSPRLDLRTVAMTGLARADAAGGTAAVEQLADAADAAVLVVRPYQTYKFVRPPFSLTLAASELPQATTAEVRAALRIAERDTTLDAAIVLRPQGEPLFEVQVLLPDGFQLDRLGPGDLEWAITTENNRQKLTVHLLGGKTGEFTLTLFGRIIVPGGQPAADGEPQPRKLAAPVLSVLGVQKQEGNLVVLPDPDTDVRLEDLKNCDSVLLMQAIGWLAADQQPLAKGALRFRSGDYSATIVLTPRAPQVSVRTITNVKVTPRAIEETILLNFRIEQAGIRKLSFLLPEALAKARLNVKLLKSRTIEPATGADGQPLPGWVRVKLELQDYVRDEFGVIVMHDRLLTSAKQPVAIPRVETGRTDQRLVAIENAGRDEVVVDPKDIVGLEPLSPQQQAWRDLAAILGSSVTQAWQASDSAAEPKLQFQTRERSRAETASARIELATTLLVLDPAGTYRALQEYRVTNSTEQFLEVELPAGSRLWTATVAGEPVKPVELSPPQPGVVRIPLVKTAEGEGDYPVQLKYGGRMPPVASLSQVRFPLVKTVNINVELSQVKLLLPESYEWLHFGGTMRQVQDEVEIASVFQLYLNKRISDAKEMLNSANPYTQMRAANNLKQAGQALQYSLDYSSNANSSDLYSRNGRLLQEAEEQIQEQQAAQQMNLGDNRQRLNEYWDKQDVKRSKNVVSGLKSNFDGINVQSEPQSATEGIFNQSFLDQNKLNTKGDVAGSGKEGDASKGPGKTAPQSGEGKSGGRFYRGAQPQGKPMAEAAGQPGQGQGNAQNPQLFNDQQRETLQKKLQNEAGEKDARESATRQQRDNLSRYGQQLEQQSQQQQQLEFNNDLSLKIQQTQEILPNQPMPQPLGGQMGGAGGLGLQPGMPPVAGNFAPPVNGPMPMEPGRPMQDAAQSILAVEADDYAAVAAGLASLDFELPQRGRVYNFTTPRGQVEITALPMAQTVSARLMGLAAVAIAVLLGWALCRKPTRNACCRMCGTVACGVLVAVVGLLLLVAGVFPLAALLLMIGGIILAIRNRCCPVVCAA